MASGSSNINYFPENQLTTLILVHFEHSENTKSCFNACCDLRLQTFCSGSRRNSNFTSSSNNIHVIQLYANKKPSCH